MNTSKIKTYAIAARRDFLKLVTERANFYGIFSDAQIESIAFKGDVAIIGDRAVPEKEGKLREKLVARIRKTGFEMSMRSAAYTWFNRFAALRYIEIHGYLDHGFRVLSHPAGEAMPEILSHAADVDLPGLDRQRVIELKLAGHKDNELYRLLIISQCNALNRAMPFLFDPIDSETGLLLPENLLHSDSPVRKLVAGIPEEDWQNVEILGWLYQFYISEKKDEVIGKVVKSEDIPAATQLFTPNWIVKYMVQNTLGRMWLATYPDSPLRAKMEYYIEPAPQDPEVQRQLDAITPKEINPEEITFLDPACGSGHILVEAYDLLKEIYLERGYRTRDIPRLILEKNLFGLDICDRAAQLAGFALLMKARADDRRILGREDVRLNVHAIQSTIRFDADDLSRKILKEKVVWFSKPDTLFPEADGQLLLKNRKKYEVKQEDMIELIRLFEHAKTFGSLITIPDHILGQVEAISGIVEEKRKDGDMFEQDAAKKVLPILKQAMILAKKFDCVVTNPPYMGGKGMNSLVKDFLKDRFTDVKSDLFSAFIVRNTDLTKQNGQLGFMSPFVWMFISSYEKLRSFLIDHKTITSLIQLEYSGFEGATVPICTFTLENTPMPHFKGGYVRLSDFRGAENQAPKTLEAIQNPACGWFFHASAADFKKIPGSPIAYWVSERVRGSFTHGVPLRKIADPKKGLATTDNSRFLRFWFEIAIYSFGIGFKDRYDANLSGKKWFPLNKGGEFRKWYGNKDYVINWAEDGKELKNAVVERYKGGSYTKEIRSEDKYFKDGITWSALTSSISSFRSTDYGALFDSAGSTMIPIKQMALILGLLNTPIINNILSIINPTLNFGAGTVSNIPVIIPDPCTFIENGINILIFLAKTDWDSDETSWDFARLPLLNPDHYQPTLKASYDKVRAQWQAMTLEMQRLEEENNRIFIEAYGLQDELTPDVPLSEITLTCNPHYRYNGDKTEAELETLLLTDTVKELISYAIGCMMGRYRLDRPGLIYAHSGNKDFEEIYHRKNVDTPNQTDAQSASAIRHSTFNTQHSPFPPDEDGILPLMDMPWFQDDAANRFVEFIKTAWPAENLSENLKFVADALSPKRGDDPEDTIRRYLSTGFYKDHLKTYKKRPIYWMFSSGKQKAFECLVYLHRYNESTLSRMRSLYVTPLQGNIRSRIEFLDNEQKAATSASDQRKYQKELDQLKKKQTELSAFDDQLRHYADMRITLDLDDGVKVNYGKFGNLLAEVKAITGE